MGKSSCLIALMVILSAIRAVPATVYTVGDSSGWSMGGDYGTWTSDKTFALGDTLVFNYFPGHTVDEVSENDYKTCTTGNSIISDGSGATSITLNTVGPHYFICGIPGHCGGGMKLSVNVISAASSVSAPILPPAAIPISPPATTISPPYIHEIAPSPSTGVTTTAEGSRHTDTSSSPELSPAVAMLFTLCIAMFQLA